MWCNSHCFCSIIKYIIETPALENQWSLVVCFYIWVNWRSYLVFMKVGWAGGGGLLTAPPPLPPWSLSPKVAHSWNRSWFQITSFHCPGPIDFWTNLRILVLQLFVSYWIWSGLKGWQESIQFPLTLLSLGPLDNHCIFTHRTHKTTMCSFLCALYKSVHSPSLCVISH